MIIILRKGCDMIEEKDWSYIEIFELGVEVCASCG